MKTPRLLFLSGLFPPALGGPGTILTNLLPRLTEKGYSCLLLTFDRDDGVARPYKVRRIPFHIRQPLRSFAVLLQALSYSRERDIIYALDTYTHGLAALIASTVRKKPLIVRFTGDSAWEKAFHAGKTTRDIVSFNTEWCGAKTALQKAIRTRILKGAHAIITDCAYLKHLVGTYGISTRKVHVIHNALKTLPEAHRIRETYKVKYGFKKNLILSLGRLVPWKGNRALLNAMPRILSSFPDTTLAFAGKGPELERLQKRAKELHIEKNVLFLGSVKDEYEKSALYDLANVYVQNTFYEGMSNALIEAMGKAKAIITTRAGGNPEFINEHNGVLIEYNDSGALEQALIDLLSHPEKRAHLGANARESAQQFTWERLTDKNSALIQGCYRARAAHSV